MKLKGIALTAGILISLNLGIAAQQQPQTLSLMPYPAQVDQQQGGFRLAPDFTVATSGAADERLYGGATRFLRRLDGRTGLFFTQEHVTASSKQGQQGLLIKTSRPGEVKLDEDESYRLKVDNKGILLEAETDIGALRGLETLLQLVLADEQGYYIPAIEIQDSPRFPWRGLMIDVARHFQPMEVIKRNLDGMAAVKMNVLHLHLTDDQGFRVESKVYPQFHEKASEGEYFTQEQIKEIIRYADARGIRVVPEFDVPGHATSWVVAFPELASAPGPYTLENNSGVFDPTLDPTNEKTYEVLQGFFAEMAALFPDPYFHIGGDENEGKQWDANAKIQAFMKKNKLADNHELQTYFNNRIISFLEKKGKKVIGWDEILQPNLSKSSVIQSWRGAEGLAQAAKQGYTTILSNGYYIDLLHRASDHYLNDPLPAGNTLTAEERKRVLGGEAPIWSELVTPTTIDSRIWPRTAAIAERLWSPREVNDVEDMYRRLDYISFRLEELGLQHKRNQQVLLRNLSNGKPIEPLQTLVDVVEPMKGYTRNPGGNTYKTYSPYTLFADAATADAPAARRFNTLVEDYIQTKDGAARKEIIQWLEKWQENHALMEPLIVQSPVLKSIEGLSANLSNIAILGLQAMNSSKGTMAGKKAADHASDTKQAMEQLEKAREQGGRTELQIVDAIEKLVMQDSSSPVGG
ncbi:beta-N-acetylhexosaminidase [Cesiribacter sp. SM1]|uniref:beta-N-acetylhexosaminidase n=1 Tax=Cesiribacter sp. SM1 TaxID=2861196 RepID=UPI001CD1D56A|nr:family 20 glycosylhydrolase [Cesiribacter sp. SM1]